MKEIKMLNQNIEFSHPKISFLVYKLKLIVRNKYAEYILNNNKINNKKVEKYNIFNDVYKFIVKFSKKIIKILILFY